MGYMDLQPHQEAVVEAAAKVAVDSARFQNSPRQGEVNSGNDDYAETRIVSEEGEVLEPGGVGEIQLRGRNICGGG